MSVDTIKLLIEKRNWIFVAIFGIFVITVFGTIAKYQSDVEALKQAFVKEQKEETKAVAKEIEQRFKYFYQGLRTMSLIPGVKNIDRYGKNLTPDSKTTLQQIYNNAYLNVHMSEIYLLPNSLDPDKIDPITKKNQEPILTFDEFIVGTAKAEAGEEEGEKLEEVEIHEYRLMKTQLEHFAKNFPTTDTFKDIDVPAIMGTDVITCDNAEFSSKDLAANNDYPRKGLIYTLPVYGHDGKFKAAVSGVLRTKVLVESLPQGSFFISSPGNTFEYGHNPSDVMRQSLPYLQAGNNNPDLIYSEPYKLDIVDVEKWHLFVAVDNQVFWNLPAVGKTKTVFWGSIFAEFVISLLVGYFVWYSFKTQISLENKVEARTYDLNIARKNSKLLLDNAGQGFFSFGRDGIIEPEYSKFCSKICGTDIAGKKVAAVLNQEKTQFAELVPMIFDEALEFSSLTDLIPKEMVLHGRIISPEFKAIRFSDGKIEKVMCIVSDITDLRKLEEIKITQQSLYDTLFKIIKSPDEFLSIYDLLENLELNVNDGESARRLVHTIKGNMAFIGLRELANHCHTVEDQLKAKHDSKLSRDLVQHLKLSLDAFLNKHNDVLRISKDHRKLSVEVLKLEKVIDSVVKKTDHIKILDDLIDLKSEPIDQSLAWLNDVFAATAMGSDKEVKPVIFKNSVILDSSKYKGLFKSFVHIARNSADHGIEPADVREMSGKDKKGSLTIDSWEKGETYFISFKDDGSGLDLDMIRQKALERGLAVKNSDEDIYLIMNPGFTTKTIVSEFSGRGVGLDAVRIEAKILGGEVQIKNYPNEGIEFIVSFKKHQLKQNPMRSA